MSQSHEQVNGSTPTEECKHTEQDCTHLQYEGHYISEWTRFCTHCFKITEEFMYGQTIRSDEKDDLGYLSQSQRDKYSEEQLAVLRAALSVPVKSPWAKIKYTRVGGVFIKEVTL